MKHLLGEATPAEQERIKQWLNGEAANLAYYQQLKKVWDASRALASASAADEKKAWERFQQRIYRTKENKTPVRGAGFGWMKIAASIIIIIGLSLGGYWLFRTVNAVEEMVVHAEQMVLNDTLPDGSVVNVNKGSTLSYPSKFKGDTRTVALKGEAFFTVTHDKKKPFIIHVNDISVKVVGTSFNVKSINGNTEVVVETGVVQVTRGGKTVELRADEKLLAKATDTALVREEVSDHLYNYYRSREFVCDDTPLWKLVDVLNEAYGANIVVGRDELRNLLINTTFNNESLDQVLNVISLTFSIKVIKDEGKIILQ